LRAGLADGTIDVICSDHSPVDDDGKQVPFAEAEPGATGLELLLPLTLKWATEERLPLSRAIGAITTSPAAIIGIEVPALRRGSVADLCIWDPAAAWTVRRDSLRSQGKNTPYLGIELLGKVRHTLLAGQVVHEG
jgi:dihydroorotase